jgi:hypothetical protein
MAIESLMIDSGKDVDMTDFEKKCYGISTKEIRD